MTLPEPTLAELARTLGRIEAEIGRRLDDISSRLGRVISIEVYNAHRAATSERLDDLAAEIADLHQQRRADDERRAADRRIITGAITTAVLSLIVSLLGATIIAALGVK
ncbi:hypothetical protein [Actinomadura rudentiformis]|uniref:Uncharacterized protein n=1 Tax=Actinomadura rudentiformis TaxID=359158 RepID=A0A6H9YKE6_9ACTN|nr:hypothetical protein [Actinomadura rudentiformis]KAB2344893.1 hypothetical protein F8566_30350 [Actinomadura rudentiformis]